MARNKTRGLKIKLGKIKRASRPAPFWARLRVFGKRPTFSWRLNLKMRRNWRKTKIKI